MAYRSTDPIFRGQLSGANRRATPATSAVVVSPERLQRASLLRRELLDYIRDAYCAELADRVRNRLGGELSLLGARVIWEEAEALAYGPTSEGRTGIEAFLEAYPGLDTADRRLLDGWRDNFFGVFRIKRVSGPTVHAINEIDQREYLLFTDLPADASSTFREGEYVVTRVAKLDGAWLMSGVQDIVGVEARALALELAARLTRECPEITASPGVQPEHGRGEPGASKGIVVQRQEDPRVRRPIIAARGSVKVTKHRRRTISGTVWRAQGGRVGTARGDGKQGR